MTLEGANIFFDTADYTIYTINSETTGQYCVVLPKNSNGTYNMLIELHMKNAFDSLINGSRTKEQLLEEIKNEYAGVKNKYSDGILVIPMLDENLYASAILNNDKQKMIDEVKKIGAITKEIYTKLINNGIEKQKIDQKITMIIKNNDDIKFVDWLKEQMPANSIDGVNLSDLQAKQGVNPFMDTSSVSPINNDIFGTSSNTSVVQGVNNDTFAKPQENTSINDIFNTPSQPTVIEQVSTQDTVQPTAQQNVENQTSAPSQPTVEPTPVAQVVTPEPTVSPATPEQVVPTPVQSTPLEATTTIQPIQINGETGNNATNAENVAEKKGSKGFTNLIILLVVLAGVTFISIELGKFLYNTYGV